MFQRVEIVAFNEHVRKVRFSMSQLSNRLKQTVSRKGSLRQVVASRLIQDRIPEDIPQDHDLSSLVIVSRHNRGLPPVFPPDLPFQPDGHVAIA